MKCIRQDVNLTDNDTGSGCAVSGYPSLVQKPGCLFTWLQKCQVKYRMSSCVWFLDRQWVTFFITDMPQISHGISFLLFIWNADWARHSTFLLANSGSPIWPGLHVFHHLSFLTVGSSLKIPATSFTRFKTRSSLWVRITLLSLVLCLLPRGFCNALTKMTTSNFRLNSLSSSWTPVKRKLLFPVA